jgi:hypothetical protein
MTRTTESLDRQYNGEEEDERVYTYTLRFAAYMMTFPIIALLPHPASTPGLDRNGVKANQSSCACYTFPFYQRTDIECLLQVTKSSGIFGRRYSLVVTPLGLLLAFAALGCTMLFAIAMSGSSSHVDTVKENGVGRVPCKWCSLCIWFNETDY